MTDPGDQITHSDNDSGVWIFECVECGERFVDPPAPVTGHRCGYDPRSNQPPEEIDAADVEVVQKPDEENTA